MWSILSQLSLSSFALQFGDDENLSIQLRFVSFLIVTKLGEEEWRMGPRSKMKKGNIFSMDLRCDCYCLRNSPFVKDMI